jgi:ABC-type glycerol-3-phosphate transport system permease component
MTPKVRSILIWLFLLAGALAVISPLYVMVSMSLKTAKEIDTTSPMSWPVHPVFENYKTVLTNPNVSFWLFFRNSLFVSVMTTLGVVLTSSMVAYAFAKMQFRGRDRLFIVLISTMMLPGIVTMIPTYILFKYLHWIDSFYPLIVPAFFGGGAYNIFLLRQFFMGMPKELDEAAFLDGATYATIFWKIVMPLSGPALATVSVFTFIYNWRDFMGPLIYLNDPNKQTLEVGLTTYNSLLHEQWHLVMAASVMVMIPLIIIFLFSQRYVVKGVVMTGFK